MKKLLRILLALHIAGHQFIPGIAEAANRFLTCTTTCTITAADTSIWGSVSGGTGASVPSTFDDVILDAGTCVAGTTCTATMGAAYNPTWQSFTMSACTASTAGCIFDANPNTNAITLTGNVGYVNTGAGTRTVSGGTWILSSNSAIWNIVASATVTNAPSISFTGTGGTSSRRFTGGGKTYGTVTVSTGTSPFVIAGANTIGTLTVASPLRLQFPVAVTNTITTFTNVSASAANAVVVEGDFPQNGIATVSSANNWTCDFCGFQGVTFSGGGTFAGTNSFNFGGTAGITITAGGPPRFIGG